ncbi:MAG TPA: o-succinylbenzoate--CoA ligase, partial [Desulfobacteraceae bacterium]|nr:o-succinylbenzoate--CoA ligase [Desulfobacteraceae bacterium]
MNLAQELQSKFKLYSNKTAIIFEEVIYTYDDIYKAVNQVFELLQLQGVKKGDRVAVQVSKSPEIIFFHIAAMAAGAIVLHLNEDYKSQEVQYFIEDSNSTLLITDSKNYLKSKKVLSGFADLQILTTDQKIPGLAFLPDELKRCLCLSEPVYTTGDDDIAMLLYTSGTTGKQKGAMVSHSALAENMKDLHELWKLSEQDISLHTLPLVHGHGLILALQGA